MKFLLLFKSLLLFAMLQSGAAFAADDSVMGPPADAPPTTEEATRLTQELASKLRCPVCQGLSVNDSKADAAVAMKSRIGELVAEGYSDDQIVDFFVDRYGDFVLLEPKPEGVNWLVWLGPVGFLGVGAGWIVWSVRGREEDPLSLPPPTSSAS